MSHTRGLIALRQNLGVANSFYFHPNLISTLDPGLALAASRQQLEPDLGQHQW